MAQNCYAVRNPTFQPAMRVVTDITRANPAVVTTSFAHQYASGTIVRLEIPLANGMQQIAGTKFPWTTYPITVLSSTTFSVPVDSTTFEPFINTECSMVLPTGEINSLLTNATRNVLPYSAT